MRALVFARMVLARWDRRVASPLPLGFVFLRRPARPSRQVPRSVSVRRDVHLHVRPGISLVLVRQARTGSDAHYHTGDRTTVFGPLVLRSRVAVRAERLVERLLARGTRVEISAGAVTRLPGEPTRPMPALDSPPQLTLRQSDPAAGDQRREEWREPLGAVERSLAAADVRNPALAAAEPALDVNRLTDQVMATIDRRLVAQAERLGRS